MAAIAAGNPVVMKPSEVSSHTAALIQKLVSKYCDPKGVIVINGGVPETTQLLSLKFDYIFYTGNPTVGKIVYEAGAKNLTPVTLELGGKSPVIVDENMNPKTAAKRICWGKFINCGQTCVAPDYVLVHEKIAKEFNTSLGESIKELYSEDIKSNNHYGRIVNARHFDRLKALVDKQLEKNPSTVVYGGKMDKSSLYIEPTILSNVGPDETVNPIMSEEIFGPVLPIIIFKDINEAIRIVNSRYISHIKIGINHWHYIFSLLKHQ
jgi:aldehyde dehydrogenase (NAD+)